MKRLLLILTLFWVTSAIALDRGALIDAIGLVETGGRPRLGAHFETGIYQLTPAVRRIVGGDDRNAALRWLGILIERLQANHVDPNSFNLALAFNGGVHGLLSSHAPLSSYDYANRVTVAYHTILAARAVPSQISVTPHRFLLTVEQPMFRFAP